jgi:hypothetical protein
VPLTMEQTFAAILLLCFAGVAIEAYKVRTEKNRAREYRAGRWRPDGNMGDQRWHDLTLNQGVMYGAGGANAVVEELLRLHGYNRTADAWKAELVRVGAWEKCGA